MTDGTPSERRRRRVPRLAVGGLMVIVLVLGTGMAWLANSIRAKRQAITAIESTGGKVVMDWQLTPLQYVYGTTYNLNPNATPPWPAWLIRLLGPESCGAVKRVGLGPRTTDLVMSKLESFPDLEILEFGPATEVTNSGLIPVRRLRRLREIDLGEPGRISGQSFANLRELPQLERLFAAWIPATDADLAHLAGLTNLKLLDLRSSETGGITDVGLSHLKGLVHLRSLMLRDSTITASGLGYLANMTELERLWILEGRIEDLAPLSKLTRLRSLIVRASHVGDSGLAGLSGLRQLQSLALPGAPITDEELKQLASLATLTQLSLSGTRIQGPGLKHLRGLSSLVSLNLAQTGIQDDDLDALRRLPSLRTLDLSGTPITDAALETLNAMPNLTQVTLRQTQVTDQAIARFRQANPHVNVQR